MQVWESFRANSGLEPRYAASQMASTQDLKANLLLLSTGYSMAYVSYMISYLTAPIFHTPANIHLPSSA